MEDEAPIRRFYAVSYEEDQPVINTGQLIPYHAPPAHIATGSKFVPLLLLPLLAFVSSFGFGYVGVASIISSDPGTIPTLLLPEEPSSPPLQYGATVAFTQPNFFAETRDAFIAAAATFIEADLATMQLRYFNNGVLMLNIPIIAKGKPGSWWQTPAGLYEINFKRERHYSSIGHVYQPWSLAFQGNFFIHGWPEYPDGTPVASDFSGGCIRLSNEDAESLYKLVKPGIPVLVYETASVPDSFLYEPKIPELETPHYLIADVESSTVLAASDVNAVAPIASVTKLMTALVAAEYINLDKSVSVSNQSFVQSLIPRLGDRSRVSMYSLLQLLLVESSNEAAEVIANQVGREDFISYMNQKAKAIGMLSTNFADPSGLSANNTSTVGDLLRLAQYIYQNRSFILELTANQNLPSAYVSGEFGKLVNFNRLADNDNFIGGKVGETLAAGQTSLSLHYLPVRDTKRVIAIVVLGSKDRTADVTTLLAYAEERFGR